MNQAAVLPRSSSAPVAGLALLWAGLLAGVSMLATPVKFAAPSLALPVALDVGRVTFAMLNRVEIGAAVLLLVVVMATARSGWNIAGAVLLAMLVGLQTVWLLPALDARVQIIIEGSMPPPNSMHLLYVIAEGAKLLVLIAVGGLNLWRLRR